MAASKLVTSLSRPAKTILLQYLRKSTKINSVYCSLLSSSPKNPKHNGPDHLMGFRFQSAKARPFSTDSGSDLEAEYRRHLGIDGAKVLLHSPLATWRPPKMDEIKINFCGIFAKNHYDPRGDRTGTIVAVARNSTGDVLGVTTGPKKYEYGDNLDLQLYALKAASNLAKELKKTGAHIGPVVYETSHVLVFCCFTDLVCEGTPRNEFLEGMMPPDERLEEVGRSCPIYCGSRGNLRFVLPDGFFDRWDSDKALSGGCCVRMWLF